MSVKTHITIPFMKQHNRNYIRGGQLGPQGLLVAPLPIFQ